MLENDLLGLADTYKTAIANKNAKISTCKKYIMILYTLIRMAHEEEDCAVLEMARTQAHAAIVECLGVEEDEE